MITETEQITAALAAAAQLWPEDHGNRARLLARLIGAGHRAVTPELEEQQRKYEAVVAEVAGIFGEREYPCGYLADLRAGWPE